MADDKIPLDPETGLDPEKLSEELEGLKDLFQDQIDKMMDENPDADWKDIVKEARDEKVAARERAKLPPCECCGENPAEDGSPYCEKCLETMKHYPIEWWKAIFPIMATVLLILACSYFAISLPVFRSTVAAQRLVNQNKLMSALNAYDVINAEIKVTDENFGSKYLKNQVEIYDKIGVDAYQELDEFIDKYYPSDTLNKRKNKYVKSVNKKIDDYLEVYDCYNTAIKQAKDFNDFNEKFEENIKGKGFSTAMVEYYRYYATLMFNESSKLQKELVGKIESAAPDMKSLYLPLYAEIALRDKDYDAVLKYVDDLSKENVENSYVYLYRSVAYRMKGNLTLAYNACSSGIKIAASDPLLNYQMAVINLLQGKSKEALNYASEAYTYANTQSSYVSSVSLYALCCVINGDTETFDSIKTEAAGYGIEFSPDVQAYIDGEKTVEDIFGASDDGKGTGDFQW